MKFIVPLALAISASAATAETGATGRVAPRCRTTTPRPSMATSGSGPISARDRSIVTVATLIAREQTALTPQEFDRALANGVTAAELSEIVTHLAFYAGWGNAAAAVAALAPI
jgi:4-carboxymuconolactone decarboxylase